MFSTELQWWDSSAKQGYYPTKTCDNTTKTGFCLLTSYNEVHEEEMF